MDLFPTIYLRRKIPKTLLGIETANTFDNTFGYWKPGRKIPKTLLGIETDRFTRAVGECNAGKYLKPY